jgi:hypothetical protein
MSSPPPAPMPAEGAPQSLRGLLEKYRKDTGRTAGGIVPIDVDLPDFGPSIFMAAELTAESRTPTVELEYRRVKR